MIYVVGWSILVFLVVTAFIAIKELKYVPPDEKELINALKPFADAYRTHVDMHGPIDDYDEFPNVHMKAGKFARAFEALYGEFL